MRFLPFVIAKDSTLALLLSSAPAEMKKNQFNAILLRHGRNISLIASLFNFYKIPLRTKIQIADSL